MLIEWFRANEAIDPYTAQILQGLATLRRSLAIPYKVFCLSARFETALARRGHTGRILNPPTYAQLEAAYKSGLISVPPDERACIHTILTDNLTPEDVLHRVTRELGDQRGK